MLLFLFRPHGAPLAGTIQGIALQGIYVPSVTLQGVNA